MNAILDRLDQLERDNAALRALVADLDDRLEKVADWLADVSAGGL